MSSNIHTLSDLNKPDKKLKKGFKKSKAENAIKYLKSDKFKKDENWLVNVDRFKKLAKSAKTEDDLVLVPLGVGSKTPSIGDKKWSRNPINGYTKKQWWSWDEWEKEDHNRNDADLGMLIKGDVGVIDFDSSESFDWFVEEFIKDKYDKDYNIYTSNETHSGGHIIFKIDEETNKIFSKITNITKWLSKPDFSPWAIDGKGCIDLKKEASTGSPVVVKLPSMLERSKKQWVNQTDSLMPLPDEFKAYMDDHIWIPPKALINKSSKHFVVELLNLIPKNVQKDSFKKGEFLRVMGECLKQGVLCLV